MNHAVPPLAELRALRREGLAHDPGRTRALLGALEDPLDLEAAGALLAGPAAREQLERAPGLTGRRVALLGSSTLDQLPHLLTAAMVRDGMVPAVRSAGFDQWQWEILSGAPELREHRPDLTALLLDDHALYGRVADPLDIDAVEAACAELPGTLREWTAAAHELLGGLTVLCTIPLGPLGRDRIVDYRTKARLDAAWHRMNAAILELGGALPATVVLSHDGIAAHAGGTVFGSHRMRHIAGQIFAPRFLTAYADELSRVARAQLGAARKCLVLDLDNTLWGGILGDDGIAGLRIGGSYPGSAHRELQETARDLAAQGVVLAIASKNDDEPVREALATHPDMVLSPSSFAAIRAGWDPKPGNVREIAAELNLGLDALVFVDDSPVERGLMRSALPEVTTVELPPDPAGHAAHLAARGDFAVLALTGEDRDRARLYQARARRAEARADATDLQEYLQDLGSRLTLEAAGPLNTERISHLFGKTNQFNLTGRRYAPDDIAGPAAGTGFYAARLTDRFGDNGLVAALALSGQPDSGWRIDNLVLSCRVFSRGVEDCLIALLLNAARRRGAPAVLAGFRPTPKNRRFADFYLRHGFTEAVPGREFRHDLDDIAGPPHWIEIAEPEGAFHAH
ncbi:HAD-IIIC family phosphatase [Streptomyces coacervatus]|uniref:HAD-IIIC family phosphatase n=1 Tax=Streptomyces coacervatus TaxID=647381 RepID=A0ABP7IQM4_9ACTN|nr:HAD-IIIC family phosphatase [Streptomyces coacervatus]MDF2266829.1 HAD-IIIC family phosphatase [Streptomyces coacervatus]